MHEHLQKHTVKPQGSSNRNFGVVFSVFFLIVGLYPLFSHGAIRLLPVVLSGIFIVLAIVTPSVLAPLNRLWAKFGELLHRVVSPVALGIVFFLSVVPIGFLMRLFSKDPLRLQFEPTADTYWIKREPPDPLVDSLNNQF